MPGSAKFLEVVGCELLYCKHLNRSSDRAGCYDPTTTLKGPEGCVYIPRTLYLDKRRLLSLCDWLCRLDSNRWPVRRIDSQRNWRRDPSGLFCLHWYLGILSICFCNMHLLYFCSSRKSSLSIGVGIHTQKRDAFSLILL